MQAKDAPANAFLTSVDNCFLTFEHESKKSGIPVHIAKLFGCQQSCM